MTSDLARDLQPEIIAMLNHSRPAIRKRAVVALYKIVTNYPDAAPIASPRLAEKLSDPDQGTWCTPALSNQLIVDQALCPRL